MFCHARSAELVVRVRQRRAAHVLLLEVLLPKVDDRFDIERAVLVGALEEHWLLLLDFRHGLRRILALASQKVPESGHLAKLHGLHQVALALQPFCDHARHIHLERVRVAALPDEYGVRRKQHEAVARNERRCHLVHLHRARVELVGALDVVERHAVRVIGVDRTDVLESRCPATLVDDHPALEEHQKGVRFLPHHNTHLRRHAAELIVHSGGDERRCAFLIDRRRAAQPEVDDVYVLILTLVVMTNQVRVALIEDTVLRLLHDNFLEILDPPDCDLTVEGRGGQSRPGGLLPLRSAGAAHSTRKLTSACVLSGLCNIADATASGGIINT
eukprot:3498901-Prymnesium_polylepis.1